MPNNSPTIILAGHGAVSKKEYVSDDKLANHHVILPAKLGGKFCYVAHNMISQDLMATKPPVDVTIILGHLENVYGVSTVNRKNIANPVKLSPDSAPCDLSLEEHQKKLNELLKQIEELDESLEFSNLGGLFDDVSENQEKEDSDKSIEPSIESEFFKGIDFSQINLRETVKIQITEALENYKIEASDSINAWQLREHFLGPLISESESTLQKVTADKDNLAERMYEPVGIPYPVTRLLENSDISNDKLLNFYFDEGKLFMQIKDCRLKKDIIDNVFLEHQDILALIDQYLYRVDEYGNKIVKLQIPTDLTIYAKPIDKPLKLSNILDILHEVCISVPYNTYVQGVFIDSYIQLTGAYEFTIPDDVNIVWGACRDFIDE